MAQKVGVTLTSDLYVLFRTKKSSCINICEGERKGRKAEEVQPLCTELKGTATK